jgi:hypothetical protein
MPDRMLDRHSCPNHFVAGLPLRLPALLFCRESQSDKSDQALCMLRQRRQSSLSLSIMDENEVTDERIASPGILFRVGADAERTAKPMCSQCQKSIHISGPGQLHGQASGREEMDNGRASGASSGPVLAGCSYCSGRNGTSARCLSHQQAFSVRVEAATSQTSPASKGSVSSDREPRGPPEGRRSSALEAAPRRAPSVIPEATQLCEDLLLLEAADDVPAVGGSRRRSSVLPSQAFLESYVIQLDSMLEEEVEETAAAVWHKLEAMPLTDPVSGRQVRFRREGGQSKGWQGLGFVVLPVCRGHGLYVVMKRVSRHLQSSAFTIPGP